MPQITAMTLNDRETTPVPHVFLPNGAPNGVGKLVKSNGIPVGNEVVTLSMRQVGNRYKGKIVIAMPVVQTQVINGISTPVAVRSAFFEGNVTFDSTSLPQERKNLMGLVANAFLASCTNVNSAFVDLEYVSG